MGLLDQINENDTPVVDDVEKNRLFQTLKEEKGSERNYLKLLAIVAVGVAIIGGVVFYMTLPGVGDRVHAAKELEDAVRSHFLASQKRTATDITFYYCGKFYWAHVDVETRTDIPGNPTTRIPSYAAKAVKRDDGTFDVTAAPITSPDMDVPCK